VVRNACKILSELKDPELFLHLAPAFRHKDERVQKAALQAVRESRMEGSAAILAGALPFLPRALREEALTELAFHKDRNILPDLIAFLKSPSGPVNGMLNMVMQIVAALPDDTSADTLVNLATSQEFPDGVRACAQLALNRKTSEYAQRLARQLKYGLPEEQKAPAKASA
jgi:HEAT repeat protein